MKDVQFLINARTAKDDGKFIKVDAKINESDFDSELPSVTSDDNGKVLSVVDGVWDKAEASGGGEETVVVKINNTSLNVGSINVTRTKPMIGVLNDIAYGRNTYNICFVCGMDGFKQLNSCISVYGDTSRDTLYFLFTNMSDYEINRIKVSCQLDPMGPPGEYTESWKIDSITSLT